MKLSASMSEFKFVPLGKNQTEKEIEIENSMQYMGRSIYDIAECRANVLKTAILFNIKVNNQDRQLAVV